jgi:hypothetical protein
MASSENGERGNRPQPLAFIRRKHELLCVHENMCQVDTQTQLSGCIMCVMRVHQLSLVFYVHEKPGQGH